MKPRAKFIADLVTPKILWCRQILENELRIAEVCPEDVDKIQQVVKKLREITDDLNHE